MIITKLASPPESQEVVMVFYPLDSLLMTVMGAFQ